MFGILGRTALLVDGMLREDWGRPKERAVLGALLVHAGRWVSIDTIIDWAWPEETALPRNRGPTFHHYAAKIRRTLERLPVPATLHPSKGGYRLDVDRSLIDHHRFAALLAEASTQLRRGTPRAAADSVTRALDLWRARPLDDLSGELAESWRTRVEDEWLTANTTLLDALLQLERFDDVLHHLGDLQTDRPDDVTLMMRRLSALQGLGRHSEEVVYYLTSRRRLRHDGDDAAAEHLYRHHERLLASSPRADPVARPQPAGPPRQLPHDIADFVGREGLLTELDAATTARSGGPVNGVVVLDGMPGVGKTALALHWAHRARSRFPGGDLYVDLQGYSDNSLVAPSAVVDDFLIALEHPPDDKLNARARELTLTRLLSERGTLVLLDNARDTEHVRHLVSLLPGALVLVTSRQSLSMLRRVTGARRVRVEPMSAPEAEELLSVRVGARRHMSAVARARLATTCAGLPLMLNLLAEHVASRPAGQVSEFADQLDRDQLIHDLGEDGDGQAIGRTFFAWSYDAQTEPGRRLFRLLGLHAGEDISVDAACACDGRTRAETLQSLRGLVGAHLLEQPVALDRYRLHDLIRVFAARCAETDEPEAERLSAVRRMVSFYLLTAARANHLLYPSRMSPTDLADDVEAVQLAEPAQAEAWFDRERKCLVAAVRMAAENGHHDHSWRLADLLGGFLDRHGYHEDGRVVREIAVTSAHIAGDRVGEASSLNNLGKVLLDLGNHEGARGCLGAALRIVEDLDHEIGQAAVLTMLGRLEMESGDAAAALRLFQRSLEIAQRIGDERDMAWTSRRMGEVLRVLGQREAAVMKLHDARWLATRIGDRSAQASSLAELGTLHHEHGDLQAAAAYCEEALRIAEAIPDLVVVAQVCVALAEIESGRDSDAAFSYGRRAIALCRRSGNLALEARAHEAHGDLLRETGDQAGARGAWLAAVELHERIGSAARVASIRAKLDR